MIFDTFALKNLDSKAIMTESVCISCGKCCVATEMILSEQDIRLILDYSELYRKREEFTAINHEGLHQLKNIDGHCFFFDIDSNKCKIYHIRPQGCRFYPLIYDTFRSKCILDQECPHPRVLYQNPTHIKKNCKSLKLFLKTQINLPL